MCSAGIGKPSLRSLPQLQKHQSCLGKVESSGGFITMVSLLALLRSWFLLGMNAGHRNQEPGGHGEGETGVERPCGWLGSMFCLSAASSAPEPAGGLICGKREGHPCVRALPGPDGRRAREEKGVVHGWWCSPCSIWHGADMDEWEVGRVASPTYFSHSPSPRWPSGSP